MQRHARSDYGKMKKSHNEVGGDGARTMLRRAARRRMTSATMWKRTKDNWNMDKVSETKACGVRCGWYAGDAATRRSSRREKLWFIVGAMKIVLFQGSSNTNKSILSPVRAVSLPCDWPSLCETNKCSIRQECLNAISFSIVWEIVLTCTLICCCWFCNFPFIFVHLSWFLSRLSLPPLSVKSSLTP